jgi:hypothetical protein
LRRVDDGAAHEANESGAPMNLLPQEQRSGLAAQREQLHHLGRPQFAQPAFQAQGTICRADCRDFTSHAHVTIPG